MSEILSQEQIDSLLNQQAAGGIPGLTTDDTGDSTSASLDASGGASGGADYSTLTNAFELFCEQAGTVVSTVLNKKAEFTVADCARADNAVVTKNPAADMICVTAPFKAGLSGSLYCFMTKKDVAMLSDLMMMGDGTAGYTDDHKDAIAELISQVMGAYTTALGDKFGESVSNNTVTAVQADYNSLPFSVDTSDMAALTLALDGKTSDILFVLAQELSAQICEKLGAKDGGISNGGLDASDLAELSQMSGLSGSDYSGFTETPLSHTSIKVNAPQANINMLLDIPLDVSIELGRTNLSIKRILDMGPGAVVELDRMAGEPVDLLVNNKVVAKGEVVVVDENFGIKIVSLVSPEDRIKSLQ
jgi:flagellar motor switch protein FliN/FliY